MTREPFVDVVIAIHDPRRRLDRALESFVDVQRHVRVTVVCHGIGARVIRPMLEQRADKFVRVVEFSDGMRSPSGPFNHGLALATADYVMIMGSDDYLEPGAVAAWIDAVNRTGADIQLAPLRHQSGELLANPLVRPLRRHRLDAVRDRLFHRTAPLGLIRRAFAQGPGPLTAGAPVGGDLAWSCRLWTSDARIDFDARHPAYVIGADADARITMAPRPISDVLAPVDSLLVGDWIARQAETIRASLVAKLVRVNILGALHARTSAHDWPGEARRALTATLTMLEQTSHRGFEDLPRSARDLLDAVGCAHDADDLVGALARYRASGRFARLIPRKVTRAFGRESVLRRYARYAMGRRL